MKPLALMVSLFLGQLLCASTSRGQEANQILFYLDQNRLIALEFQITVDGKTVHEMWEEALDKRFKAIDKNQDGKVEGEEQALLPNTRLLVLLNVARSATHNPAPASLNRTAFSDYLEKLGFQPFKVNIQLAAPQNTQEVRFLGGMPNNPNASAEKLFGALDADADGRLSNAEIKDALASLAKQDFDQDETISAEELVPTGYNRFFVSPSNPLPQRHQTAFLSVTDRASYRTIATQLTAKYDTKEKDNALSQAEVGVGEKLFAEHDIDANGKWDFEEIQQYLHSPKADVIVKVKMGTPSQPVQPAIEFEHGEELTSEVKNAIGSLNLNSVQMEMSTVPEIANVEDLIKGEVKSLDSDNNGYLDKEESRRLGPAQALFTELDRDGDEKLFLEEMVEGVLPVVQLLMREVHLTVTDRGRDLFRILDTNGDSRLSKRELWAMPNRAGALGQGE